MTPLETTPIPTTPIPPTIDAARRLLVGALDHPGADPRRPELLAISEALIQLGDVRPPYPPVPDDLPAVDPLRAIDDALAHLTPALDEARSIQELSRIGLASLTLRRASRAEA